MPPKKKVTAAKGPRGMGKPIPAGQIMADLTKKEWMLGPVIGQGGFGYIYLGKYLRHCKYKWQKLHVYMYNKQ